MKKRQKVVRNTHTHTIRGKSYQRASFDCLHKNIVTLPVLLLFDIFMEAGIFYKVRQLMSHFSVVCFEIKISLGRQRKSCPVVVLLNMLSKRNCLAITFSHVNFESWSRIKYNLFTSLPYTGWLGMFCCFVAVLNFLVLSRIPDGTQLQNSWHCIRFCTYNTAKQE